jgi:hypothetical protein
MIRRDSISACSAWSLTRDIEHLYDDLFVDTESWRLHLTRMLIQAKMPLCHRAFRCRLCRQMLSTAKMQRTGFAGHLRE